MCRGGMQLSGMRLGLLDCQRRRLQAAERLLLLLKLLGGCMGGLHGAASDVCGSSRREWARQAAVAHGSRHRARAVWGDRGVRDSTAASVHADGTQQRCMHVLLSMRWELQRGRGC